MRKLKNISVVLLLFLLVLGSGGCKSNNREVLNQKISEGELLLTYIDAYVSNAEINEDGLLVITSV